MKLIDISRELLTAPVYPGDPLPSLTPLVRMAWGDVYNTSALSLCTHSGTHMDAPLHFLPDAADIAEVSLDACIGECTVVHYDGVLLGDRAEEMLDWLQKSMLPLDLERLLIKGNVDISASAAFVLASSGLRLIGVEPQSVTTGEIAAVHRELLGSDVVLLEGLDLTGVEEGRYFLFAAPMKISGSDGAPVRAVLIER